MSKKKQHVNTAAAEHQLAVSATGPKILFSGGPHDDYAPLIEGVEKLQPTSFWSLRNKTEDVARALKSGDNASARMAAYELGMRLPRTTTTLQANGLDQVRQAEAGATSIESLLARFEQEQSRLIALPKNDQALIAAEVVSLLFGILDALDKKIQMQEVSSTRRIKK